MRAMYPESPAKRRWGTHRASILPPRGAFAVRSPRIMHGAQILPPSDGLGPCAGAPARAAASRDRPSTARPLPRGCLPPAPRQYPPPADTRRLLCPLQSGTSRRWTSVAIIRRMAYSVAKPPRNRRLHHLEGQADNGMLRRAGPKLQNREQVGAEPPAESAGPAGPASAPPKTPIERTSPS